MEEKFLISITGKSGSGKSTFAGMLAEKIDAKLLCLDKVSHLSLKDEIIKKELRQIFGDEIFDEDGAVIRKKLGSIVFKNEDLLEKLNSLSQKYIEDYIDAAISESDKKYIILEYALLPRLRCFNKSNYKILMIASDDIRISRLTKRDNVSIQYLADREKHIQSFENIKFDEIIENNTQFSENLAIFAENTAKKIQTPIS